MAEVEDIGVQEFGDDFGTVHQAQTNGIRKKRNMRAITLSPLSGYFIVTLLSSSGRL
ncbi:MAG: hypothetical protein V3T66_09550 [Alphaproteobacteria bacterium]